MQTTWQQTTNNRYSDHGGYIAGLDSLRALAVLSVIGYHIFPNVVLGGFLGVDIFFVVSGFLISTLLIREIRKNGKIALSLFWIRRMRRLIPPLIALILLVVPLAMLIERDLLVGIARQILGALTFSTNWLEIAHGSSYFDTTVPVLFKNFWSLAIEEQFYLFWPLLFIFALAIIPKLKIRLLLVAVLAVASALLMALLYSPLQVTRVYYGTDTHLFGLAIGIILAFAWSDRRNEIFARSHWVKMGQYYGCAALALILAAIFFLPDDCAFTYRGGIFIVSLLTFVLIAAMLQPRSILVQIGEKKGINWIGTRSYGIYLWHWPILVLITALFPTALYSIGYFIRSIAALIITCGICELSFQFLETPIRKQGFRLTARKVFSALQEKLFVKVTAGIIAGLLIFSAAGIILAPEKSKTQAAIEKAEQNSQTQPTDKSLETDLLSTREKIIAQNTEKITDPEKLSANLDVSEPKNEEITVIGDSMFSAAKTGLDWAMPGVKFLGKSNRQWKDAPQVILDGYQQGMIGRVVVLGFGTNAGVSDAQQVETIIADLGADRIILLMNLYSPSKFIASSNQILQSVADKYANVGLIDWNAVAAGDPNLLQVDQTHPSIAGANTMGQLIRTRVSEFSAELAEIKAQQQ